MELAPSRNIRRRGGWGERTGVVAEREVADKAVGIGELGGRDDSLALLLG